MNVAQIVTPLRGEHLGATSPKMSREIGPDWHQRLNFWSGRALTAEALEIEQEHRAAHLAWQGRIPTPGIVTGLEVALEEPEPLAASLETAGHFLHVLPGHGFTVYGEDVTVPRPLRIPLHEIPIRYARVMPSSGGTLEPQHRNATASIPLEFGGMRLQLDEFDPGHVPWAAVLVARPSELRAFGKVHPDDPCELDLSRDAFADERRLDATALWLFQLPASFEEDGLLSERDDPRWRNRLAHLLFNAERTGAAHQYLRFLASRPAGDRWDTVLTEDPVFPWELFGVPMALLSSEASGGDGPRRFFLDRGSVTRPGGLARARSRTSALLATEENDAALHPPGAGTPALWRARVDQFAEHLASLKEVAAADQAAHFQFVPPVGLLPRAALDFLTTEQAIVPALVTPGQPPDRAAVSKFFPPTFEVEAVPIPTEDLDAALAASAPLAPFNFAAGEKDAVRVLVPVAQRVFDPQLLVVELEDPFFAAELLRLIGQRQDWRQRRNFHRSWSEALRRFIAGPQRTRPIQLLEPGQIEIEPVETGSEFTGAAYSSPKDASGPSEISAKFDADKVTPTNAGTTLYVRLRLDLDDLPPQIEMRWFSGTNERIRFAWTEPSPLVERTAPDGTSLPVSLWRLFKVKPAELGTSDVELTSFTLRVEKGRVAVSDAGRMALDLAFSDPNPQNRVVWWNAKDDADATTFSDEPWERLTDSQIPAPFEELAQPDFADGDETISQRLDEINAAANPPSASPRAIPLSVETNGVERVLAELDTEADEADDFVDANFVRAQTNLYRIRQLILGRTAAQKLLINPAIAVIAEQETASASAEQLGTFIAQARNNPVTKEVANLALHPPPSLPKRGPTFAAGAAPQISPSAPLNTAANLNFNLAAEPVRFTPVRRVFTPAQISANLAADSLKNVRGQLPETGPVLPPRGLTIGERFTEPPATRNLSFARAALTNLVQQLTRLRLPLGGETVRSLTGTDVSLLDLQGRAAADTPAKTDKKREDAVTELLKVAEFKDATDEAQVTLVALDFIEVKSAILRTIERVIQRRRVTIKRGQETLAAMRAAIAATEARLNVIAGPLAEARHDVSVARALRQEEQARIAAINVRRDALIRDEVNFLAYVRPRAVDPVRRNAPGWKLESADTPAPIPACLQRHDQPPDPLRAYVQLFRHAPAAWFTDIAPRLRELDTPEKLQELLAATQRSALAFSTEKRVPFASNITSVATQSTLLSAYSIVEASRTRAVNMRLDLRSWTDFHQEAVRHSSLGDIIDGRHGHPLLARDAADVLQKIEEIATCLHAEFAAVPPASRLMWVERYSQFDRPAPLNDLTSLPRYGSLDRTTRRRFQAFVDWLFGRVFAKQPDAFNLINDLVRICLLLASHAPVKTLIAGHLPRPVPVRRGVLFPIVAFDPRLVRVGMEVHVWQGETVVARARVEDLREDGEVSARIEQIQTTTTTLDQTMRVQFVPAALGISKPVRLA